MSEKVIQFTGLKSRNARQNDAVIYWSQKHTLAAESAWRVYIYDTKDEIYDPVAGSL